MEQVNWFHVIASLIGGGAAGAIINTLVSSYKSRLQPVGRRLETLPVFIPQSGDVSSLTAKIAVMHGNNATTFNNLYLAEVQVVNKGNKDLDEFKFGITLGDGDKCIFVTSSSPDRHHEVLQETEISPQSPRGEVDFKLRPFNRRDSYFFKLYIVIPEGAKEPGIIELGSPSPVRFSEMPTVGELLARVVEESVKVGPLSISMRKF